MLTYKSLKLAWQWIKKYAWIFFAVVAGILAIILLRRDPSDLANQLDEIRKRHEEEVRRIREAEELRLREREESQRRLEQALRDLDDRYKKALGELDAEKRAEADRVLRSYNGDPQVLAEELAKVMDFRIDTR